MDGWLVDLTEVECGGDKLSRADDVPFQMVANPARMNRNAITRRLNKYSCMLVIDCDYDDDDGSCSGCH
jgi:hypothetical protein